MHILHLFLFAVVHIIVLSGPMLSTQTVSSPLTPSKLKFCWTLLSNSFASTLCLLLHSLLPTHLCALLSTDWMSLNYSTWTLKCWLFLELTKVPKYLFNYTNSNRLRSPISPRNKKVQKCVGLLLQTDQCCSNEHFYTKLPHSYLQPSLSPTSENGSCFISCFPLSLCCPLHGVPV